MNKRTHFDLSRLLQQGEGERRGRTQPTVRGVPRRKLDAQNFFFFFFFNTTKHRTRALVPSHAGAGI